VPQLQGPGGEPPDETASYRHDDIEIESDDDRAPGKRLLEHLAAAAAFGTSERTLHKWRTGCRAGGIAALEDRRSVQRRIPHRTPAALHARIVAPLNQPPRMWEIAWRVG
jgi:hypothetical protein